MEEYIDCPIFSMIEYDKKRHRGRIYVNVNDSDMVQRCSVAHELGHFFLHIHKSEDRVLFSFRNLKNKAETEANEFAIELLLQKEQVRKEYDEALFHTAFFLANVFEVPANLMRYRLTKMGLWFSSNV